MNYLLFTVDTEELTLVPDTVKNHKKNFDIGKKGTERILTILKKTKTTATFFVTKEFAEYNPSTVRRIVNEGHEVASHGYSHHHDYRTLPEKDSLKYLREAREYFKKKFGITLTGFRAPNMYHPSYSIIAKAGFSYDSSLHPTWVPGHYNNFFKNRKPHTVSGVKIIPVSVSSLFRKPFSWFWFRNFGLTYAKCCTLSNLMTSNYVNIYFHPWDVIDLNTVHDHQKISFLIRRNSGEKAAKNIGKYLLWCSKKGLKSITMKEFVSNHGR